MKAEDTHNEDWFKALTFEAFRKYGFEWDHRHSQEENTRLFLKAVENYGYDSGRQQTLMCGD